MNQKVITRAGEEIAKKSGYIGDGMEGFATLAVIDKSGYPTASTYAIAKSDGINWITFNTSITRDIVDRIRKCNRGSVCINSSEYNITLVGTFEILTDEATKRDNWFDPLINHFSSASDPDYCVLRFTTEHYNLFVDFEDAAGILKKRKDVPNFEPILIYNNGQCVKAMELYKKAFGAEVTAVTRYSEASPKDVGVVNESEKDFMMNAQMRVGQQTILLCDDNQNNMKIGNHVQMVLEFDTEDGVKAAYNALVDGATDLLPPHSATYSPCVAGLTDAYGIPWQLMVWHGY